MKRTSRSICAVSSASLAGVLATAALARAQPVPPDPYPDPAPSGSDQGSGSAPTPTPTENTDGHPAQPDVEKPKDPYNPNKPKVKPPDRAIDMPTVITTPTGWL